MTPPGAKEEKRRLRREFRARLREITPDERRAWSAAACARVGASEPFRGARTIMGYLPLADECDVTGLLRAALEAGKRVCLPRASWVEGTLAPCVVRSLDDGLVGARYGLREPGAEAEAVAEGELEFVLVPGLGFDACCGRIGRGGGFYDRLLGRLGTGCARWGVAFEAQIVEELPLEAWDQRVDAIATEARLIVGGVGTVGR